MATTDQGLRIIAVNQPISGFSAPRLKSVRPKKISDYPHVRRAYLDAAQKLSSPFLLGPPICDELIALVQHLFTEEEAAVVRHMQPLPGKTAAYLARAKPRRMEEFLPLLDNLAEVKRVIVCVGPETRKKYALVPIL